MMGDKKKSSDKRPRRLRSQKIKTNDSIETLSGEKARHIPQEIVAQILVRLPVKSLLKFKCVGKSWLALISSPNFIKDHLTYSTLLDPTLSKYRFMLGVSCSGPNNTKLVPVSFVLHDLLTAEVDAHCPDEKTSLPSWINGSCNGLLCVTVRYQKKQLQTFLWNPCLRMSIKLPPMPETESQRNYGFSYGIGYDERSDDYKVVGLRRNICGGMLCRHIVVIYSLKNDSWKRIEDFKGGCPMFGTPKICANGKIHFLASFHDGECKLTIVSLDLENEVYGTVEHPEVEQPRYGTHCSLGRFKGCIGVLYTHAWEYADVWILKEYGVRESWTKVVRVPYDESLVSYLRLDNLCILSNGKVLLGCGSRVVVYNPKYRSFIYPQIGDLHQAHLTGIYAESLVPLIHS